MPRTVTTVADLTEEHVGWEIQVADPDIYRRTIVLAGLRTRTNEGRTRIALLDSSEAGGPLLGTEREYPPDAACAVLRKAKRPRRRPQKKTQA
jgi:hypothetical protein